MAPPSTSLSNTRKRAAKDNDIPKKNIIDNEEKVKGEKRRKMRKEKREMRRELHSSLTDPHEFILQVFHYVRRLTNIGHKYFKIQQVQWTEVFMTLQHHVYEIESSFSRCQNKLQELKEYELKHSTEDTDHWEKSDSEFNIAMTSIKKWIDERNKLQRELCDKIDELFSVARQELTEHFDLEPKEREFMGKWQQMFQCKKWELIELNPKERQLAEMKLANLKEYELCYNVSVGSRPVIDLEYVQEMAADCQGLFEAKSFKSIPLWKRTLKMVPFFIFLDKVDWNIVTNLVPTFCFMKESWRPKIVVGDWSPFEGRDPIAGYYKFYSGLLSHAIIIARAGLLSQKQKNDHWLPINFIPKKYKPLTVPRDIRIGIIGPEIEMTEAEIAKELNDQHIIRDKLHTILSQN